MGENPHCGSEGGNSGRELSLFVHLVLAGALYLAYLVLSPAVDALVFAAVIASLATPAQDYLARKFNGRKNLSAFLVVFTSAAILIVPLLLLLAALTAEGVKAMESLKTWVSAEGPENLLRNERLLTLLEWVRAKTPFGHQINIERELTALSQRAAEALLKQGTAMAANAASLVASLFILFFLLFYFVRDGRQLIASLSSLTPLRPDQDALIVKRVREMSKSVFVGTFLTALCQGTAGGLGFVLVGIPGFFWGAVMALASLIPLVGTALIWLPAVVYLVFVQHYSGALFLAVWCVVLVGGIDNFLRPFLMRGEGALSPLFVFLGVIGGLSVFGLAGILYGPLILTFAAAILDLYRGEMLKGYNAPPPSPDEKP